MRAERWGWVARRVGLVVVGDVTRRAGHQVLPGCQSTILRATGSFFGKSEAPTPASSVNSEALASHAPRNLHKQLILVLMLPRELVSDAAVKIFI